VQDIAIHRQHRILASFACELNEIPEPFEIGNLRATHNAAELASIDEKTWQGTVFTFEKISLRNIPSTSGRQKPAGRRRIPGPTVLRTKQALAGMAGRIARVICVRSN